jgi:ribosomal protein S18 acetylase RimI-like enzyme
MIDPSTMTHMEDICIAKISVEELRADTTGSLIEQITDIAYHAFREPPWNDDLEKPRLHLGLGVDLMRCNASAYIARTNVANHIVGYILGYEVVRMTEDPRDLTLGQISGANSLDYLFDQSSRVFYMDTICVDANFRQKQTAYKLVINQIDELCLKGFTCYIGRTAISNVSMKSLFNKLGFKELKIHDALYPDRTFWLLEL